MGRRNRSRGLALNAEINVVSLIDVILLLLLIFMITAPMMTGGIDVRLPSASAQQQLSSRDPIRVEQKTPDEIWVDNVKLSFEQFRNTIAAIAKGREEAEYRGDASISYGTMVRTVDVLQAAGITALGFVTTPDVSRER